MTEYALYKGDDLLHIGTVNEIAEHRGVLPETIKFYRTPTYQRRIAKRKNARNYLTLIRLEEEDEEQGD